MDNQFMSLIDQISNHYNKVYVKVFQILKV
jgi:hypothetical protein